MDDRKGYIRFFIFVATVFQMASEYPVDACPRDTDSEVENNVNCTFDTGMCSWENIQGSDLSWNRSFLGNTWLSLSMEDTNVNQSGRIGSPWICNAHTRQYYLLFRYYVMTENCQLSVYIKTTESEQQLTTVDKKSFFFTSRIPHRYINSIDCAFQIIIEAKKIKRGICGLFNAVLVDDITLTTESGKEACIPQTTAMSVSSLKNTSLFASPIITFQPSDVNESTTAFARSNSFSEEIQIVTGNRSNAAPKRNENDSNQVSPGAIVAIVISLLVIAIGIIVFIAYRRNKKNVCCDSSELFKGIKINTKSNSNLTGSHFVNNYMYSAENKQITVPTNCTKPYQHGENLGRKNQEYEMHEVTSSPYCYSTMQEVTSSPYCYSTMQDADANSERSQSLPVSVPGRNLKSVTNSDADEYNTLHVTPSSNPQRVAMDAYDHVHTTAYPSHIKTVQEDNEYSLARITADSTDDNSTGNSNRNPLPCEEDGYNSLNIARDNYSKGDGHSTDLYDHLDVGSDDSFSRGYINTNVKPGGIMQKDVD